MRLAAVGLLAGGLVGIAACGERAPMPAAPAAPATRAASEAGGPAGAGAPAEPLELAVADETGAERAVRWAPGLEIPERLHEDVGVFAYARRKTELRAGDVAVGWLEPGARVGVTAVNGARVEVTLFGWSASGQNGRVRAWARARDLGPTRPGDAPAWSHASGPERLVRRGQTLLRPGGAPLGYTFCGSVELLGEDARGTRVRQREEGIVLEAILAKNPSWEDRACPGLLVLREPKPGGWPGQEIVYHDRRRLWRGAGLPAGLVERGPFEGPTFAQLAARRARIYWLVEDREKGPSCQEWQLVPPKRGADDGQLVAREKLDDGDTIVVRYGMSYSTEADTGVTLLGPSSEVIAPPGRQPHSGGVAFGCGSQYKIVASAGGVLTLHTDPPALGGGIYAYDPRDTERWYTDAARCRRDA
jgi:hypothetical protein